MGFRCHLEFDPGSLKSQLRMANRLQSLHVLIVGEDELAKDRYALRRMEDSQQWEVSPEELEQYLAGVNSGAGETDREPRPVTNPSA